MRANDVRRYVATALLASAPSVRAQQPAAPAEVAVEPGAMAALKNMGTYLRTLKTFEVDAATSDEEVLDDGQKVLTEGTAKILAQMPNRLYAEVSNHRSERTWVYDGCAAVRPIGSPASGGLSSAP